MTSGITDEEGTELLTCNIIRSEDLDFATDADVRGTVRRLAAMKARIAAEEFKLREMAMGFTHKAHSLLNDASLDGVVQPASQYCHDWMHTVLVTGVFNTVVFRLFSDLWESGFRDIWAHVGRYVLQWEWPGRVSVGQALGDLFNQKMAKATRKAHSFKASASDGLALYAVIALFVSGVLLRDGARSLCYHGCVAYLALCDLLDMLVAVPRGIVTPAMLAASVDAFLTACVDAHWETWMHSKFHWLIHLPKHLARFGCLPTCFVHERKHKVAKRYANAVQNTKSFEKSILGETLAHHLAELKSNKVLKFGVALVNPKVAKPPLVQLLRESLAPAAVDAALCRHSLEARILPAGSCYRRDVVFIRSAGAANTMVAGEVWTHASVDGVCMTLCNIFRPLPGAGERRWDGSERRARFVATEDILSTCIHTSVGAGNIRIVVPWHLRRWAIGNV